MHRRTLAIDRNARPRVVLVLEQTFSKTLYSLHTTNRTAPLTRPCLGAVLPSLTETKTTSAGILKLNFS